MKMTKTIESERQTRIARINPKLKAAGWQIVAFDFQNFKRSAELYNRCAIEEFPTLNGPADYALFIGGQILGVI